MSLLKFLDFFFFPSSKKPEKRCCDPNVGFLYDAFTREVSVDAHTVSLLVRKSRLITPLKQPHARSPSALILQWLQHFSGKTLRDFSGYSLFNGLSSHKH